MADELAAELGDTFVRKAEARLDRAKMHFGQKILILERMRREVIPLREAMCRHRAQKAGEAGQP